MPGDIMSPGVSYHIGRIRTGADRKAATAKGEDDV